MDIEIFCLCDFAQEMGAGKMVIVGTFDTIFTDKMPWRQPTCSIVARVRFIAAEVGKHGLQVGITDPEGVDLVPPFHADLDIKIQSGHDSSVAGLVMGFGGLEFKKFGPHSIVLRIDGKKLKSLPLYIRPKQ